MWFCVYWIEELLSPTAFYRPFWNLSELLRVPIVNFMNRLNLIGFEFNRWMILTFVGIISIKVLAILKINAILG